MNLPGLTNAWLMPINARLQMLSTGIKTPVGIKVAGPDLTVIQEIGQRIERVVARLPGTASVFAERVSAGRYSRSPRALRHGPVGLTVMDVQEIIATAVGGMNLTEVVDGRERYPVNLRYPPEARDSVRSLALAPRRGQPWHPGPARRRRAGRGRGRTHMIRTENARLNGWVYVDIRDRDVGSYVAEAKQALAKRGEAAARLLGHMVGPIPALGAGEGAAVAGGAAHPCSDPAAAVPQLPHPDGVAIILGTLPLGLVAGSG